MRDNRRPLGSCQHSPLCRTRWRKGKLRWWRAGRRGQVATHRPRTQRAWHLEKQWYQSSPYLLSSIYQSSASTGVGTVWRYVWRNWYEPDIRMIRVPRAGVLSVWWIVRAVEGGINFWTGRGPRGSGGWRGKLVPSFHVHWWLLSRAQNLFKAQFPHQYNGMSINSNPTRASSWAIADMPGTHIKMPAHARHVSGFAGWSV